MQRILVIDDDDTVRSFLKRGLYYEGYAVDVADSGESGLKQLLGTYPDLVILDWMMPGLDGIEVLQRLRAGDENLPVIMLTGRDTAEDQVRGLEAGANDYVTKPISFDVLVARIRRLLKQRVHQPTVLHFADLKLDTESFTVWRNSQEISLTSREFQLLQVFMENPGRVMSKQQLLEKVWGSDFKGNPNIVEVFIKQLRRKLEGENEERLIQNIRGVGYVLR